MQNNPANSDLFAGLFFFGHHNLALDLNDLGRVPYGMRTTDLEVRAVHQNVMAIDHAPFVTRRRGGQMILVVVDSFGAIPVFVLDDGASLPFLMFNVCVVVVMVLGLGNWGNAREACGKNCKR